MPVALYCCVCARCAAASRCASLLLQRVLRRVVVVWVCVLFLLWVAALLCRSVVLRCFVVVVLVSRCRRFSVPLSRCIALLRCDPAVLLHCGTALFASLRCVYSPPLARPPCAWPRAGGLGASAIVTCSHDSLRGAFS